ncbi:MAG: glycosyl hydrolase [Isosphaeraceae bacterium]
MFKALLVPGILVFSSLLPTVSADELASQFARPPQSARPWVYWFWLNSNITKTGITKDLEAMKRVGIGGALIMEVDQGAPVGQVPFMSDRWREMFHHAITEARRLGLSVNMNNDAGWNGSGGPWIRPEQSMQEVVWTETEVAGPKHFEGVLPRPHARANYYRDIAVLALPDAGSYRIPDFERKAAFQTHGRQKPASPSTSPIMIEPSRISDLTARMAADGRITWDVPAGKWTILRLGHTTTGVQNAPAPASGRGLECDKLSRAGIEANFAGLIAKVTKDVGASADKGLVATHIDSWENGSQNWTERMKEEFRNRRGYDMTPFLPVMTGRVVTSLEVSERFLWDLRRTISELVIANYAGRMSQLAHQHGLRFTAEAYGSPCDHLPYAGQADEPMGEFWVGGGAIETCRGMASAAHTYDKTIVGAEAFTATDSERWTQHPASIKALGDQAFCEGINRFVFHRYALQPWADVRPGMTMGPWGVHYERTQTWWNWAGPWHDYLARCQFFLRQGQFVADVCFLQPEAPPYGFIGHTVPGYGWDECSADVVMNRMSVRDGRLVLKEGMSYRLLVLPESTTMTPELLGKIKELVEAGATVLGPRPGRSPSLRGYPKCDEQIKGLADRLWGDCDGTTIKERRVGQGRIIWGIAPEKVLADSGVRPDFTSRENLRSIHRRMGDTDLYFIANPSGGEVNAVCSCRVAGKQPEFWWPDTGRIEPASVFVEQGGITRVSLPLGPSGSVFVVFRKGKQGSSVAAVMRDGKPLLTTATEPPVKIIVRKAVYGVPGDPRRTRDVRAKVQQIVDAGADRFQVARLAEGDDPAFGVVKTVIVDYTIDGQLAKAQGTDPETIVLASSPISEHIAELHRDPAGHLLLEAWKPGRYELKLTSAGKKTVDISSLPKPLELNAPWDVAFSPGWGAPEKTTFDRLMSWSDHADAGVKYYSGTAVYTKEFSLSAEIPGHGRRLYLNLGKVEVMAHVKVNGKNLGILWKPPFLVDVTGFVRPGKNSLEVKVVNLWINRMIGDEQLPEDSERNPNGTLKAWPRWLTEGKPSPTGRFTFTTWRLWKKGDALVPSGLIGPVRLLATQQVKID